MCTHAVLKKLWELIPAVLRPCGDGGWAPSPHSLRKWAIHFLSPVRGQQGPGRWEDVETGEPKRAISLLKQLRFCLQHQGWRKDLDTSPVPPGPPHRTEDFLAAQGSSQVIVFCCGYNRQYKISWELYWQRHLEHNGLMLPLAWLRVFLLMN